MSPNLPLLDALAFLLKAPLQRAATFRSHLIELVNRLYSTGYAQVHEVRIDTGREPVSK